VNCRADDALAYCLFSITDYLLAGSETGQLPLPSNRQSAIENRQCFAVRRVHSTKTMEKDSKIRRWVLVSCLTLFLITLFSSFLSALNQSIAIETSHLVVAAENKFIMSHGRYGSLQEIWKAGYISIDLSNGSYRGFCYSVKFDEKTFRIIGEPLFYAFNGYWGTGRFMICLNQNGEPCMETNKQ